MAGQAMANPDRIADSYADVLIHRITSKNSVWDTITGVSLADLDPNEDPERAIKVLSLKGDAMATVASPMTTVKGDGMLTLKGGITMIN